jgi:AcrR family transcriptional regulator
MSKPIAKKRTPSRRVMQKRERARRDILQVAQDVLHEGGVESVTLASVAGQLGMTKQALYHYFPSKEAMLRGLVTTLLDDEIDALILVIDAPDFVDRPFRKFIQAFYDHYIDRLDAFRTIYCQTQVYTANQTAIDRDTLREEINPSTRRLFDRLEERIAGSDTDDEARHRARRLAFTAWTSVLGLLTMLSIADATNDPLVHSNRDLLDTLSNVFDQTGLS